MAGWHFDEGQGSSASDSSGNGHTLTLTGGPRWVTGHVVAPPVHYLHQDHLGTTSLVTTAAGAWAGASFHAPFGAPWHAAGTLNTDRRYTGQRSLENSLGSLYHYQARWYSPVLGRFLSPDPIVPNPVNPQHLNRYSYALNNPFLYTDPSGLVIVRNSAGEVWDGEWGESPEGGRFRGRRKLYDPGDLTRLGSSRWLACRDGECTPYKQHYYDGYWVLRELKEDIERALNCKNPDSTPCLLFQRGLIPGVLGVLVGKDRPDWGDGPADRGPTTVYHAIEWGQVVYVGITNDFERREREHWREKGIRITRIPGLEDEEYENARSIEEALIVYHKLGKEGGTLLNERHSISPLWPDYLDRLAYGATRLFQEGYYDDFPLP